MVVENVWILFDNVGLKLDRVLLVSLYKFDLCVYEFACGGWFVVVHWWDVMGVLGVGLRSAWVSCDDVVYLVVGL